jgi:hypothetical protein
MAAPEHVLLHITGAAGAAQPRQYGPALTQHCCLASQLKYASGSLRGEHTLTFMHDFCAMWPGDCRS